MNTLAIIGLVVLLLATLAGALAPGRPPARDERGGIEHARRRRARRSGGAGA